MGRGYRFNAFTSATLIAAFLMTLVCITSGNPLPGETEDTEVFDGNDFEIETIEFTPDAVTDDRDLIDKVIDRVPWLGNSNNTSKYGTVARFGFIITAIGILLGLLCVTCCCCCCCCGCCGICSGGSKKQTRGQVMHVVVNQPMEKVREGISIYPSLHSL